VYGVRYLLFLTVRDSLHTKKFFVSFSKDNKYPIQYARKKHLNRCFFHIQPNQSLKTANCKNIYGTSRGEYSKTSRKLKKELRELLFSKTNRKINKI
jgi:hypothetical protein